MSDEENGVEVVLEEPKQADEPEVEIEIAEEKPEKQAKKVEKQEVSPEEGISELKKNLEREKQARLDAERRAQEAYQHAQQIGRAHV